MDIFLSWMYLFFLLVKVLCIKELLIAKSENFRYCLAWEYWFLPCNVTVATSPWKYLDLVTEYKQKWICSSRNFKMQPCLQCLMVIKNPETRSLCIRVVVSLFQIFFWYRKLNILLISFWIIGYYVIFK